MNKVKILKFLRKVNNDNYWSLEEIAQITNKEKAEVKKSLDQITRNGYIEYKKDIERWTISFRGKIKAQQRVQRTFKKQSIKQGLQQVSLNAHEINNIDDFFISVMGIKMDSVNKIPEKSNQIMLIYTIKLEEGNELDYYGLARNWAYKQNYSYSNPVDMIEFPYQYVRKKLKSGSHMFTFKQVEEKEYLVNDGLEIFSCS